jgi:hypothetical protein
MSAANTRLAMTALTLLLVTTLVAEPTVVGAMTISITRTELPGFDALISVMIHGTAVVSMIPTSVVLDGNAMKSLANVAQTWQEKDTAATLPVLNTATHIQKRICIDAIPHPTNVKNVTKMIQQVAILIK